MIIYQILLEKWNNNNECFLIYYYTFRKPRLELYRNINSSLIKILIYAFHNNYYNYINDTAIYNNILIRINQSCIQGPPDCNLCFIVYCILLLVFMCKLLKIFFLVMLLYNLLLKYIIFNLCDFQWIFFFFICNGNLFFTTPDLYIKFHIECQNSYFSSHTCLMSIYCTLDVIFKFIK
jgi:hypothetical protein